MSNAFVASAIAQTEIPPIVVGIGLAWLVLSILIAKACGAFKRASIVGPPRLANEESAWSLVSLFFFGFCAAFLAGNAAAMICKSRNVDANLKLLVSGIVLETAAFLFLTALSAKLRPNGTDRLGLKLSRLPHGIMLGLAALFVLYPIVMAVGELTSLALQWAGRPEPKANEVLELVTESHQHAVITLGVLMAVVVAPFFEELAFRGFLQTVLGRLFNWLQKPTGKDPTVSATSRWAAVFVTAACFAYVHGEIAFMPPLFLLAIGLGYLYERSGNLWATIVTHSVFNGMQILLVLKLGAQ